MSFIVRSQHKKVAASLAAKKSRLAQLKMLMDNFDCRMSFKPQPVGAIYIVLTLCIHMRHLDIVHARIVDKEHARAGSKAFCHHCWLYLCMTGTADQKPSMHARLTNSTYAQALKPPAKCVRQRLTMRPLASLERHCHTSASLRPMHWQAAAFLPFVPVRQHKLFCNHQETCNLTSKGNNAATVLFCKKQLDLYTCISSLYHSGETPHSKWAAC